MKSFFTYIRNVRGELAHVTWPSNRQTAIFTALVIVISAVVALYLAGLDYVFTGVIDRLITGS